MRDDKDNERYKHFANEYGDTSGGFGGWFIGIIVALALFAIGYLVFSANQPVAAQPVTVTITDIKPSKKNLGASIAQCIENDGVCISKELVLSD